MSKNLIILLVSAFAFFAFACGEASTGKVANAPNPNANVNTVTSATVDQANLPPGLSGTEIKQPVNAPGIPAVSTPLPKGATPTPGIPSAAELKKPFKPGATPTPGIPDPETIRKALGQRPTNVNTPPPSGNRVPMMMKANRKVDGKP